MHSDFSLNSNSNGAHKHLCQNSMRKTLDRAMNNKFTLYYFVLCLNNEYRLKKEHPCIIRYDDKYSVIIKEACMMGRSSMKDTTTPYTVSNSKSVILPFPSLADRVRREVSVGVAFSLLL